MDIKRNGSQPSGKGPAEYFTGTVPIDPLFQASDPARGLAASVTFEPCAPTAWHTHPLGQILIVTSRCGLLSLTELGAAPLRRSAPGRRESGVPPGEKHWHGATPTTAMTHVAIVERLNGKAVEWMEKVTDDEYLRP